MRYNLFSLITEKNKEKYAQNIDKKYHIYIIIDLLQIRIVINIHIIKPFISCPF